MARGKNKGGYQKPNQPAAVSGPGEFSARTDGGPTQPVRVPTGGPYGQATDLRQQQQAAPLPRQGSPAVPTSGGRQGRQPTITDPFRSTERPGEPGTTGAPIGAGPGPTHILADNPDLLIGTFAEQLSRAGFTAAANKLTTLLRRA